MVAMSLGSESSTKGDNGNITLAADKDRRRKLLYDYHTVVSVGVFL